MRDPYGQILFAEAVYFGHTTSISVESRALLHGLQLCAAHGLFSIQVETDSQILFHMLQTTSNSWPWNIYSIIVSVQTLLRDVSMSFVHIYREANSVADFLAVHASTHRSSTIFNSTTIPRKLKRLLFLDQIGCPTIRLKKSSV